MNYVDPSTGRTYPLTEPRWRGDNGHYLNLEPGPGLGRDDIEPARRDSVWRYAKALLVDVDDAVSMGEGWTPLVAGVWAGAPVLFKLEFLMPTGSFKDRGMTVMVSYLKSRGVHRVLEDSSGNAGASLVDLRGAERLCSAASWCRRRRPTRRSPRSPRAAPTSSRFPARGRTSRMRRSARARRSSTQATTGSPCSWRA